ncbi:MAG: hypothetical protein OXI73_13645 [Rhodospirillales bacterium]|nr:hypothetical protein [Rhodospirillales bacterium]
MPIRLTYGSRQQFRCRHHDITVLGRVLSAAFPVKAAEFALNASAPRNLYVEQEADRNIDWLHGYKPSPAELRCRDQGEFCIEVPATDSDLATGENRLAITVKDGAGTLHTSEMTFAWSPDPVPLPLDLRDLAPFRSVQEIGQVINGAFDLDPEANLVRSRGPVAPDALLLLGSQHGNQEATYRVRFTETAGAKWLGLSDFFAGLTEGEPQRGIKVGWCSAGMAALSPTDGGRSFLAWGDHSGDRREWAIATDPAAPVAVERDSAYRVRHQSCRHGGIGRVRYRIWPEGNPEPADWLCVEEDRHVPPELPRNQQGAFGLFQHMGHPIEWSDILVQAHDPAPGDLPGADPTIARLPFLRRERPGAF